MEKNVTKISYTNEVTVITLSSLPGGDAVAKVLHAFAEEGIIVDMISQTVPQGGSIRLSFTVSDRDLGQVLTILGKLSGGDKSLSPEILPGNCKIVFYDSNMVTSCGVAAKVFSLLSMADIRVILITTSLNEISILVSAHAASDALHVMSGAFGVVPEEEEI